MDLNNIVLHEVEEASLKIYLKRKMKEAKLVANKIKLEILKSKVLKVEVAN